MEKKLLKDIGKIFKMRATFDSYSDKFEQEKLFVSVPNNSVKISQGRVVIRSSGIITCFTQVEKMPIGYFQKMIAIAPLDIKERFFFNLNEGQEKGIGRMNLKQSEISFTYFYSGEYNPPRGIINKLKQFFIGD